MFLGELGTGGLHVLLDEVVGLCLMGATRGAASQIDVTLHADGSLSVADNGPGLPAGCNPAGEAAGLAYSCTHLGDTSLVPAEWGAAKTGQWFVCANALAEWFEAEVRRADGWERQRFERGYPVATPPNRLPNAPRTRGSYFRWLPDREIFPDAACEPYLLRNRLRTHALLASPVRITLTDEQVASHQEFQFARGVADFVELLNTGFWPGHTPIHIEHSADWGEIAAAIQYHSRGASAQDRPAELLSFVNHRLTTHGTHLDALRGALCVVLNRYAREIEINAPTEPDLKSEYFLFNASAVVTVRMASPKYEGSYRQRLGCPELFHDMEAAIRQGLETSLATDPRVKGVFWGAAQRAIRERARDRRKHPIKSLLK
jgi:DNA gyrase/topoisomerase IV subunit B